MDTPRLSKTPRIHNNTLRKLKITEGNKDTSRQSRTDFRKQRVSGFISFREKKYRRISNCLEKTPRENIQADKTKNERLKF